MPHPSSRPSNGDEGSLGLLERGLRGVVDSEPLTVYFGGLKATDTGETSTHNGMLVDVGTSLYQERYKGKGGWLPDIGEGGEGGMGLLESWLQEAWFRSGKEVFGVAYMRDPSFLTDTHEEYIPAFVPTGQEALEQASRSLDRIWRAVETHPYVSVRHYKANKGAVSEHGCGYVTGLEERGGDSLFEMLVRDLWAYLKAQYHSLKP